MYVHIRVQAGAKREVVTEVSPHHLAIAVREPSLRNLANRRIMAIVAVRYGVVAGTVRLISGHRSSSKILSVG